MAARLPFLKWRCWKSIGSYPYTYVLCRWSLKLIFKAKVKLESGNQKIQYGLQAAILKVTSLKINRLLPMATINMHMKFEIEIPQETWLMLRKPCCLQTYGRTDGRTEDGRTRWIQYTPPPTLLGGGIINKNTHKIFTIDTPQLILTGELWGVYCEYSAENWPCFRTERVLQLQQCLQSPPQPELSWTWTTQGATYQGTALAWHLTNKMAAISQTKFTDTFSLMKFFLFWLKFHLSLFLRVQLTINQHWFR